MQISCASSPQSIPTNHCASSNASSSRLLDRPRWRLTPVLALTAQLPTGVSTTDNLAGAHVHRRCSRHRLTSALPARPPTLLAIDSPQVRHTETHRGSPPALWAPPHLTVL